MVRYWHASYMPEVVKSLDEPIHPQEPDGISFVDLMQSTDPNPEELLLMKDKRREIREALKRMRPHERAALLLRAQDYTLEEIGSKRGVCRERVRQWERDAKLVAKGLERFRVTDDSERRRRRAARARYAANEQLRRKEIDRVDRWRKAKRDA